MVLTRYGLEGRGTAKVSGEFFNAVCLNLNTAESCATEVYQIQTGW